MAFVDQIETPIGTVHLEVRDGVLRALSVGKPIAGERQETPVSGRLRAYFEGDLHALDAIPVDPEGSPFQKSVWSLLRQIPVGKTTSYAELAKRLRSSPRAVGRANGSNPIALVIPCHRVIAKDGTLCGYAYGLQVKEWLLRHEGYFLFGAGAGTLGICGGREFATT